MSENKVIALVTGASAGIGAEYCRQLAKRCDLIIAVGRREDRLTKLASQLADLVEMEYIAVDLATPEGSSLVAQRIRQLGSLDYLINNAGFSTYEEFTGSELSTNLSMVSLHINTTLILCEAVLPLMRAKRKGVIINMSSIASYGEMKLAAVYGATKAFLNSFSVSLQAEEAEHGIKVQCICPGPVITEFAERDTMANFDFDKVPGEAKMNVDTLVSISLEALQRDEVMLIPGTLNQKWVRHIEEKKLARLGQ